MLSCTTLILECEVNSRARHPEIVVSTINNVPAEIADPANVRREANFQAGSELANRLRRGTQMLGCDTGQNGIVAKVKAFSLTAAEDGAASRPNVRRKARTMDRKTECERS
jgi:hypothetical protein